MNRKGRIFVTLRNQGVNETVKVTGSEFEPELLNVSKACSECLVFSTRSSYLVNFVKFDRFEKCAIFQCKHPKTMNVGNFYPTRYIKFVSCNFLMGLKLLIFVFGFEL